MLAPTSSIITIQTFTYYGGSTKLKWYLLLECGPLEPIFSLNFACPIHYFCCKIIWQCVVDNFEALVSKNHEYEFRKDEVLNFLAGEESLESIGLLADSRANDLNPDELEDVADPALSPLLALLLRFIFSKILLVFARQSRFFLKNSPPQFENTFCLGKLSLVLISLLLLGSSESLFLL